MRSIVFLLPGRTFTQGFVKSFDETISSLMQMKALEIHKSFEYSSDIYACRNTIMTPGELGPYPVEGKRPFNGKIDYDWLLWIDSDMVFTVQDVMKITSHNVDVVSGVCPIDYNRVALADIIEDERGVGIQYHTVKSIQSAPRDKDGLVPVQFAGFAFLAVKRGVFEALEFPWFRTSEIMRGKAKVVAGEDFAMCERIREAGFTIYADPDVKIGHEKAMVLKP